MKPIFNLLFTAVLVTLLSTANAQANATDSLVFNATGVLGINEALLVSEAIVLPENSTSGVYVTLTTSPCTDTDNCQPPSAAGTVESSIASLQCWNPRLTGNTGYLSGRTSNFQAIYISPNSPTYLVGGQNRPVFSCIIVAATSNPGPIQFEIKAITQDAPTLEETEQQAAASMFNSCCQGEDSCTVWKATGAKATGGNDTVYTDMCQVPGFICSSAGSVLQLDIGGYNMKCEYPLEELAAFRNVQYLYTGFNQFTGDINTLAANLTASLPVLLEWDASHNDGITGALDEAADTGVCLLAQANVIMIRLGYSGVGGTLPDCLFNSESQLKAFYASETEISGSLPPSLATNSSLMIFQVSGGKLSGSLPSTLSPSLLKLNVSNNEINGDFPAIPTTSGSILTTLDVSNNQITGAIPGDFILRPKLQFVDLSGNQLSSAPAEWIQDKPLAGNDQATITDLGLKGNKLGLTGFPIALGYLKNITSLDISETGSSGDLPEISQGTFTTLQKLWAADNEFTGTIPDSWESMGIFGDITTSSLQILDLRNNKLSGDIPGWLATEYITSPVLAIGLDGNDFDNACYEAFYPLGACSGDVISDGSSQQPVLANDQDDDGSGVLVPAEGLYDTDTISGDDGSDSLGVGAIIGIVFLTLAVVGISVAGFVYWRSRRSGGGRFERFDDGRMDHSQVRVEMAGGGGSYASTNNGTSQALNGRYDDSRVASNPFDP